MSEPVRLKAGALLQLGTGAARRQPGLVLPLALAEVCAGLLGLVPAGLLLVRLLAVVARIEEPDPGLAFIEAVLVTSTDPGLLALATIGALLAGAGGWLLRTTVRAGAARALAAELQEDPERVRWQGAVPGAPTAARRAAAAFGAGVLDAPERWLLAAFAATVLRLVAFVSAVGAVVAGMVYFTHRPSPLAALVMTVATCMAVALPYLDVALSLGFLRSVLVDERPLRSLGEGLMLAVRRADALIPAWFLFVLAELLVGLWAAGLMTVPNALPPEAAVPALGMRVLFTCLVAAATAVVVWLRLGTFVAAVVAEAGLLPVAPAEEILVAAPVPPGEPAPSEPVLEAVEVPPEAPTEGGLEEPRPEARPAEEPGPQEPAPQPQEPAAPTAPGQDGGEGPGRR